MQLNQRSIIFILVILGLAINWQVFRKPPLTIYQDKFIAFGTIIDVSLSGLQPDIAKRTGQSIQKIFNTLHNQWHAWHDSDLTRFNQHLKQGFITPIPISIQPLLKTALPLAVASQHLFNPALGQLIALWGFHQDDLPTELPKLMDINALQPFPTLTDLHIEATNASTSNPHLQLDFGAFAKGYALDQIIQSLQQQGIKNALINAGGDLKAIGKNGARPWRIGIRHPRQNTIMATIDTRQEESIFTSGDYERYFKVDGQRYHHLLDPLTGFPAKYSTSVTVIHRQASTADAAATALFIAKPQQRANIAKRMGIQYFMLVDNQQVVIMTRMMAERITFLSTFKTIKIMDDVGTLTAFKASTD